MTLQEYINQNPEATLAQIQSYPEISQRMISSKTFALYLDQIGLYLIVHDISNGKLDTEVLDELGEGTGVFTPHPAKEACLLITNTLSDSSSDNNDFNFMQGTMMGDGVISRTEDLRDTTLPEYSVQIQSLLDVCIAHCNIEIKPFEDVTQSQVNMAKGISTEVGFTHIAGREIVIDLKEDLPERVAATVMHNEVGFADESLGKNTYVQDAQKYRIKMTGVARGTYQVRIPFEDVDFTVESI